MKQPATFGHNMSSLMKLLIALLMAFPALPTVAQQRVHFGYKLHHLWQSRAMLHILLIPHIMDGGINNKRNKSYQLLFVSIFFGCLLLVSCDLPSYLLVNGSKRFFLNSDSVTVSAYNVCNKDIIVFNFNGEYPITEDSLKLQYSPKNFDIDSLMFTTHYTKRYKYAMPDSSHIAQKKHNITICIYHKYNNSNRNLKILPCNFILNNGKRIINDTITIKEPKKYSIWPWRNR